MKNRVIAGLFLATFGLACGAPDESVSETETASARSATTVTPGAPLTVPASTWSWVDVPEAVCDDGSPTGFGIWPSATSNKVMFYFAGGGACWDYDSCVANPKSAKGPYGAAQFAGQVTAFNPWVIGQEAANPFKDWTKVYVPYCTGDLHGGDIVKTYTSGSVSKDIHHKGHANVLAYLSRIVATYPTVEKVLVTGSSAGGGGAVLNYQTIRDQWPTAAGMLIDDSLPFFKSAIPSSTRTAWFANWNIAPVTTPLCGSNCFNDMSLLYTGIATLYPNDRKAFLSFTTDVTIAAYFKMNWFTYWSTLKSLTQNLETLGYKRFTKDTWGHTLLTDVAKHTSGNANVKLYTFLTKMESGDPTWVSVGP